MKPMKKYNIADSCSYCGTTNGHNNKCPIRPKVDNTKLVVEAVKKYIKETEDMIITTSPAPLTPNHQERS